MIIDEIRRQRIDVDADGSAFVIAKAIVENDRL